MSPSSGFARLPATSWWTHSLPGSSRTARFDSSRSIRSLPGKVWRLGCHAHARRGHVFPRPEGIATQSWLWHLRVYLRLDIFAAPSETMQGACVARCPARLKRPFRPCRPKTEARLEVRRAIDLRPGAVISYDQDGQICRVGRAQRAPPTTRCWRIPVGLAALDPPYILGLPLTNRQNLLLRPATARLAIAT